MMHDASQIGKRQMHHVQRYAARMESPAERLKAARLKAGYETAKAAAEAMGATVSTYIQHESGVRGYPSKTAARYARYFRVAPEWLLYGRGSADPIVVNPELQALPLIGQVRAGAWLALDDSAQDEPMMLPAALDTRYPNARQWLREVVGDSMNAKGIHSGDLVHLADWAETGSELKTGQVIEVTRYRDGGELREVTLKEVEVNPARGFLLWPRSTNPKWKEPFVLNGEDDSGVEVRVTGLLLAAIRRF
jgi:SOS-response transcriptional repressor LexA